MDLSGKDKNKITGKKYLPVMSVTGLNDQGLYMVRVKQHSRYFAYSNLDCEFYSQLFLNPVHTTHDQGETNNTSFSSSSHRLWPTQSIKLQFLS